jgi:DNA-binding CsgD family transcriptional regulator
LRFKTSLYERDHPICLECLNARDARAHPAPDIPLTDRQTEILRFVAQGRTAKEMVSELGISTETVEFHKAELMDRLGIHTTADLTLGALKLGLITPG